MLGVDETGMAALWQRNRRHGKWTAGTLPPTHLRDVGKVVEAAPEALTAVQIALLTIGGKLAEVTLIYTILVFSISYATTRLGFSRSDALHALIAGSAAMVFTIPASGWGSPRRARW